MNSVVREKRAFAFRPGHSPLTGPYNETSEDVAIADFGFAAPSGQTDVSRTDVTVPWNTIEAWLDSHPLYKPDDPLAVHAVIRMIWIPHKPLEGGRCVDAPEAALAKLVDKLRLRALCENLSTHRYDAVLDSSRHQHSSDTQQYGIASRDPLYFLVWSFDQTTQCSQAICCCHPDYQQTFGQTIATFHGPTLQHPLALALAWSLDMQYAEDSVINRFGRDLNSIEVYTGYHGFDDTTFVTDVMDLIGWEKTLHSISKRATGLKTGLAVARHRQALIQETLQSVLQALRTSKDVTVHGSTAQPSQTEELSSFIQILLKRQVSSSHEIEQMNKRTEAQITAIFHLITQDDTKRSIQLAESSTALAADSRALAEAASRDAKAMKTLAVVTMVYLPPTAIATIFAMPFFDWNKQGSSPAVTHSFWVYWATAVPLTLATLLIWWLWIKRGDDFKTIIERIERRIQREQAQQAPFLADESMPKSDTVISYEQATRVDHVTAGSGDEAKGPRGFSNWPKRLLRRNGMIHRSAA